MQHSTHVYKLAPVTACASRGPRIGCNWIRLGTEVYNPCLPRFYYQILALVRKMGLTAQSTDNDTHLLDCLSRLRTVTHCSQWGPESSPSCHWGSDLCLSCPRLGDREGKDQGRLSHSLWDFFSRYVSAVPYLHGIQKISLFGSERVLKMTARYVENTHTQSRLKSAQFGFFCCFFRRGCSNRFCRLLSFYFLCLYTEQSVWTKIRLLPYHSYGTVWVCMKVIDT